MEICEVYNWEDDAVQLRDPAFEGGKYKVILLGMLKNLKSQATAVKQLKPTSTALLFL